MLFNSWLETPIPIHIKFHLFNWTNPDKISNASVKPHFEECGPYVFTEKHTRVNLTWHDNGTISYNQIRTWHFDESLSNGSLDDMITFLNPVTAVSCKVSSLVKNDGRSPIHLLSDGRQYDERQMADH